MEITDEKKEIIREAIRIIHNICAERSTCIACPFKDENMHCIFNEKHPDNWPLSVKNTVEWNYLNECE